MEKTDEEGNKINSGNGAEQTNMAISQTNDEYQLVVEAVVIMQPFEDANATTRITSAATIDSKTDPNATVDEGTQTKPKKVLSIGICSVDIVHYVEKFPEDDIKVHILDSYWQRGGSASNVCSALHGLGVKTEFMGVLSSNPTFQFLIEDCQSNDIDIDNCSYTEKDPPFASVIMSRENGGRTTIHSEMAYPALSSEEFSKLKLDDYNWIHIEGRNYDETKKILQNVKQYNAKADEKIKTSVDLQQLDKEALELAKYADVVTVGRDYAEYMGWANMKDALNGVQDSTGEKKPITVCYWDEKGAACLDSEGKYTYYAPIPPVEMVDSLGVHDAFTAGFIFANLHLGLNPKNSTSFGNRCASFKLGQRGYEGIEKFIQCSCCCHIQDNKPNDATKVAGDNDAVAPENRAAPSSREDPENRAAPRSREDLANKAAPVFERLENQKPKDDQPRTYNKPPSIEKPATEKESASDSERASVETMTHNMPKNTIDPKPTSTTIAQKSILDSAKKQDTTDSASVESLTEPAVKKASVTVSQKSILDPVEKKDTAPALVKSFMDPNEQRDTVTVSQKSILDPVEKRDIAPASVKSFMDPEAPRDSVTVSQKSILDPKVKKEDED